MCRIAKYQIICERVANYNADIIDRKIRDSGEVADFIMNVLKSDQWPTERFMVFAVDSKLRILGFSNEISIGTVDSTIVDPKEVFRFALSVPKMAGLIVSHQHPSGDPAPSQEDIDVTRRLQKAGEILSVKLIDHIIVGNGCYTSMKSDGYMD